MKERRKAANESRLAKIRKRKGLAAVASTADSGGTDADSGGASSSIGEGSGGGIDATMDDDDGGGSSLDAFLAQMKEQSKAHAV